MIIKKITRVSLIDFEEEIEKDNLRFDENNIYSSRTKCTKCDNEEEWFFGFKSEISHERFLEQLNPTKIFCKNCSDLTEHKEFEDTFIQINI